jgi:queuine tRNA-ribosyltransferase
MFEFKITKRSKKTSARAGTFYTPHGKIRTPAFMPVGTYGAVKTLTPDEVRKCGAEIILGNTFHLEERPGSDLIKRFDGLHKFMRWDGPILTDSGGFQVFSLSKMRKVSDEGVEFRSPVNGEKRFLTPKKVLEIQQRLGSDIMMQLDECVSSDASRPIAERALSRTQKWMEESLRFHKNPNEQALFPIVQGANFPDLRTRSAKFCADLPVDGVAIGGLAVGESKSDFLQTVELVAKHLPADKPRYLMGVGEFDDIVSAVKQGIDLFDCVIPTRLARHGSFFGKNGKRQNIRNAKFRADKKPLLADCKCEACINFSRAYLRHLFMTNEVLGLRLFTIHNLTFMFGFMKKIKDEM